MHTILKDFKGSPDGFTVVEYKAGQELELPPSLVPVAIENKWAKPAAKKVLKAPTSAEKVAALQAERVAALQAEIAELETQLAAAEEADKPALAEQLAAKQQELAALTE